MISESDQDIFISFIMDSILNGMIYIVWHLMGGF